MAPKRVSGIKLVVFSQHNDALNDVSFPLTLHYDEFLSFSAIFEGFATDSGSVLGTESQKHCSRRHRFAASWGDVQRGYRVEVEQSFPAEAEPHLVSASRMVKRFQARFADDDGISHFKRDVRVRADDFVSQPPSREHRIVLVG